MEVVNTTSTIDPVNMYNYLNNYILNYCGVFCVFVFFR